MKYTKKIVLVPIDRYEQMQKMLLQNKGKDNTTSTQMPREEEGQVGAGKGDVMQDTSADTIISGQVPKST